MSPIPEGASVSANTYIRAAAVSYVSMDAAAVVSREARAYPNTAVTAAAASGSRSRARFIILL